MRHRRAIERQFVTEAQFTAEELVIRVLQPARTQDLVRHVVHVLQDEQPGHQPGVAHPSRADLVRRALRLEWLTAAWMAIEATVAIASGILAGSLSLIAFGADSLIELASAGVLLWRLQGELQQGVRFSHETERRASKNARALLFALAVYLVASA